MRKPKNPTALPERFVRWLAARGVTVEAYQADTFAARIKLLNAYEAECASAQPDPLAPAVTPEPEPAAASEPAQESLTPEIPGDLRQKIEALRHARRAYRTASIMEGVTIMIVADNAQHLIVEEEVNGVPAYRIDELLLWLVQPADIKALWHEMKQTLRVNLLDRVDEQMEDVVSCDVTPVEKTPVVVQARSALRRHSKLIDQAERGELVTPDAGIQRDYALVQDANRCVRHDAACLKDVATHGERGWVSKNIAERSMTSLDFLDRFFAGL